MTSTLPILFIAYDNFQTNKLFSYECEGVHIIPIFTNVQFTNKFLKLVRRLAQQLNDKRQLGIVICTEKEKLIDILTFISICNHSSEIIINPDKLNSGSIPVSDFLHRYQEFDSNA